MLRQPGCQGEKDPRVLGLAFPLVPRRCYVKLTKIPDRPHVALQLVAAPGLPLPFPLCCCQEEKDVDEFACCHLTTEADEKPGAADVDPALPQESLAEGAQSGPQDGAGPCRRKGGLGRGRAGPPAWLS